MQKVRVKRTRANAQVLQRHWKTLVRHSEMEVNTSAKLPERGWAHWIGRRQILGSGAGRLHAARYQPTPAAGCDMLRCDRKGEKNM